MPDETDPLAAMAYAVFALQQPGDLAALEVAARTRSFPLALPTTPAWFAAAAAGDSSLIDMAPELQVLPADLEQADQVDLTGIDLIHVYAPEMQVVADLEEAEPEPAPAPPPPVQPRTSTQLGLLKELGDLDA
jgi:hypothetical protein